MKFDPDPKAGTGTATSNCRMTALGVETAEDPAGVDNLNGSGHLVDASLNKWVPQAGDYARKLIDYGYALEFRIPYEYINEPEDQRFMVTGEGEKFGMAINFGDNDSGARGHMLQWSAGLRDAAHSNALYEGSVTYLADHKLKLEAVSLRDATVVNDSAAVWYNEKPSTGVSSKTVALESFNLPSNYPNPFNPGTKIRYQMKRMETATLAVYNVKGEIVRYLVADKIQSPGFHEISWDGISDSGDGVSGGVYIYKFTTPSQVTSKKMLLLK